MRVLLQSLETLKYLCGEESWTAKAHEAVDFYDVVYAVDYALDRELQEVRVVIKFADAHNDIYLPAVHLVAHGQDA